MMLPTADDICAKAGAAVFGNPVVPNTFRGLVAEIFIAEALAPDWRHTADWEGWDFEHTTGCRLEVKQSAARQTWHKPGTVSKPIFDIAARTGHWENGADWKEGAGRNAHIYVFARHPVVDETADQRDPAQWRFYVVATNRLPAKDKSISLAKITALTDGVPWSALKVAVETAANGCQR